MKLKRGRLLLPLFIGAISLSVVVIGLSRLQTTGVANRTPTPIPTVALDLAPDVTPSLGLSVLDSTGAAMVYVPTGCFIMGKDSPANNPYNGGQPFKMCLPNGYWIDKTVVTNAAYQQFIDAGGYQQQGTWWSDPGWAWLHILNKERPYNYEGFTDPQQPRVGEMWYEASAYCHWRGARLPTEPEWEYAARGPNSLIYPWGNTFAPSNVVYAANSGDKPEPVGSKPGGASWVGALDMSGNVGQWTSTAYEHYDRINKKITDYRYPYPATDDGRETGNVDYGTMVVRGGSWDEPNITHLNTAFRSVSTSDQERYRQINISFRCVRTS